jgi:Na+-transporting NADH:ubiquinone oxidoreductase subunit NqrF
MLIEILSFIYQIGKNQKLNSMSYWYGPRRDCPKNAYIKEWTQEKKKGNNFHQYNTA